MSESIRAFVAIEIEGAAKDTLTRIQGELREFDADVRWVPDENLHLTLHFLGSVDANRIPAFAEAVRCATDGLDAIPARIEGVGSFPPRGTPRVVWAGVSQGSDELTRLHRRLSARLQEAGYEPERRTFHPHVTLGRVRSPRGIGPLRDRLGRGPAFDAVSLVVREVSLIQSRLTPRGANYDKLRAFPLRPPTTSGDPGQKRGGDV